MKIERLGAGIKYTLNMEESEEFLKTGELEIIDMGQHTWISMSSTVSEELEAAEETIKNMIKITNLKGEQVSKLRVKHAKSGELIGKLKKANKEAQDNYLLTINKLKEDRDHQVDKKEEYFNSLGDTEEKLIKLSDDNENLNLTLGNLTARITELEKELKNCNDSLI